MKKSNEQGLIQEFKTKIKEQEDVLFGMKLYLQGACFMYKHNKELVDFNRRALKNIEARMKDTINKAKQLFQC